MIKRVLSLYKPYTGYVVLTLILVAVSSGISMVSPYFIGLLTDAIIKKESIEIPIKLALLGLMFNMVNKVLSLVLHQIDMNLIWFPIQEALRFRTLDNYFRLSVGQMKAMSNHLTREILAEGEDSMMRLGQFIVRRLIPMCAQFVIITGILFWYHYVLGIIIVTGLLLYGISQWYMEKKYTPLIQIRRDRSLESSRMRSEVLSAAALIRMYTQELFAKGIYKERYIESIDATKKTNLYINRFDVLISFVIELTQVVAFIAGLYMVYQGTITFGYLTTVSIWWGKMCSIISTIGEEYQTVLEQISHVKRFFTLVDTPSAITERDGSVVLRDLSQSISFENVYFAYPSKKDPSVTGRNILKGVSFSVTAGQSIAFVGPSGSGKSTIVSLVVRAFDPTSGTVRIDGVDLKDMSIDSILQHVAMVDQNSLTMNLSIRQNIQMGSKNPLSDESITDLCRSVGLYVLLFEQGLDTVIGDMGSSVSGGERQRIAIARALAGNPSILILDEPTSSLDAVTEAKIREVLKSASVGRTTITVAHRITTIQDADRIFVVENGEISASGRHEELLERSEIYRQYALEQYVRLNELTLKP